MQAVSRAVEMGLGNQIKTGILLAVLTGLMLLIGQLIGGTIGLVIAAAIALAVNFGSFWYSKKIVLKMYRAQKADPSEYKHLHEMVEEISREAKIPKPEVYVVPSNAANAFATGRSPSDSAIAFTTGIMKLLNRNELKGVTAHEISHVKNRDTLVTTIAATIAGVISYLALMGQWMGMIGGFGGNDEDGGNFLGLIAMAILAPLTATIVQLAVSRSREYLADHSGANAIQNSEHLASALEKLERSASERPLSFGSSATSSLFIVNPFKHGIAGLFSTHPPMEERVKKLRSMKF